jgi:FkbM family methyltransferase
MQLANGVLFKAYPDCVVSSALIYSSWPEYWELQFLRQFLRQDNVVIDVGANVGHVSLLLADVVGSENIFAFEPTPVSYQRLRENWELNGWCTDRLYPMAVGSAPGTLFIRNATGPETTNAVHARKSGDDAEVPVATLDSLCELWRNKPIGLLKIDVEGFEGEVFRGGAALLRSHRPGLIMFESLNQCLDPLIGKALSDAGYQVFQLDESGKPDLRNTSAQNLFAVPMEELISI